MPRVADRVQETFTTTGTGTLTLAGAVSGYRTFASQFADAETVYYFAQDAGGTNWECGIGTIGGSGTTLARTTIKSSSNSGSAVSWAAGTKNIFCEAIAALIGISDLAFYGDGSDSSATLDGSTTILGMVPSANVYTATRDLYFTTLIVNTGVTLKMDNFRCFASVSITTVGSGAITSNGVNASGLTAGTAIGAGSLAGGANGGNGRSTLASGIAGSSLGQCYGGNGGAGGAVGANTGGAGGVGSALNTNSGTIKMFPIFLTGWGVNSSAAAFTLKPGNGGGGGGSDGSGTSGGGGSGGGFLIVASPLITNNGTISANGGNGANATGTNAGGGGGGGGGVVNVLCDNFIGNTPTATGGTKGTSAGTGTAATDGSAGTVTIIRNL